MKERLFRSRKERVIGGVCGGIAEYFGIDPIIVRIIFIVLAIGKGLGLLAYIILWIAVPEEPIDRYYARFNQGAPPSSTPPKEGEEQTPAQEQASASSNQNADFSYPPYPPQKKGIGGLIFGIGLIAAGVLFLFWNLIPSFDFDIFFPIVLVILGIFLIYNSIKK